MEKSIAVNLTTSCNQDCVFCRAGQTFPRCSDLGREGLERIIEWAEGYSQAKIIEFCGGEPTLHPELLNFIKLVNHHGFAVQLITNGTRLEKLAGELSSLEVSVQVSVEAPSAELHNRIVGRNSFAALVRGIREAVRFRIPVSTNTTAHRLNFEQVLSTVDFVRRLGIKKHSINYLVPNAVNKAHALSYDEISELFKKAKLYADLRGIHITTLNPVPHCIGYNDRGCSACLSCIIEPNLDVYPCLFTQFEDLKMGNLKKDTPETLAESRAFSLFRNREYLPEKCRKCSKFGSNRPGDRDCWGGCYCFWRFGLLKESDVSPCSRVR